MQAQRSPTFEVGKRSTGGGACVCVCVPVRVRASFCFVYVCVHLFPLTKARVHASIGRSLLLPRSSFHVCCAADQLEQAGEEAVVQELWCSAH